MKDGLPDQSGEGLANDGMCRTSQRLYEAEEGGSAEREQIKNAYRAEYRGQIFESHAANEMNPCQRIV